MVYNKARSILKYLLMVSGALVTALFVVMLMLAFTWGSNQHYSPAYVESRIGVGMTLEDVSYQLGRIDHAYRNRKTADDGSYVISLSKVGLGAWLAPQHEVYLEFDPAGKLSRGYAKVVYQIADGTTALRLDGPH